MQYHETPERSTVLLRLALPLMSRQAAALHPLSYAVWYAYVADTGSPLHHEVDKHLARHGSLDEAATEALYRRHIADFDPGAATRVSEGLQQLVSGMSASAALANDQTARYGHTLEKAAASLAQASHLGEPAPGVLGELLTHTQQMQDAMARLQHKLAQNQREIDGLRDEVRRARQESMVDPLTGLANRRAFDQRLATCLTAAELVPGPARPCVLMADLDNFKQINDSYGHGFGDQVLRAVAQVFKALVAEPQLAARVGGEEFAVLLPAATLEQARQLAEKLRATVAASRIRRKGQEDVITRVTVSLGVAEFAGGDSPAALMENADRALYASKTAGRDRVSLHGRGAAPDVPAPMLAAVATAAATSPAAAAAAGSAR